MGLFASFMKKVILIFQYDVLDSNEWFLALKIELEKIGLIESLINWNISSGKHEIKMNNKKDKLLKIGNIKNDKMNLIQNQLNFVNYINRDESNTKKSIRIKNFFYENEIPKHEQYSKKICNSKWCKHDIHFEQNCPWFGNFLTNKNCNSKEKNSLKNYSKLNDLKKAHLLIQMK